MAVIYRILNVVNDHVYVGSTNNPRRRRWEHWSSLKQGAHHCAPLQQAWLEFGADAFEFEVLEEVADSEQFDKEDLLLQQHYGKPHCYNTSPSAYCAPMLLASSRAKVAQSIRDLYASGDYNPRGGRTHSEETRALISERVQQALSEGRGGKFTPSAETRLRMSEALKGNQNAKGHARSEEHRRKLSEANKGNTNFKGKNHTEETKTKMRKRVLELSTNTEFSSLTAALEHYNFKMPTLRRALLSGKPLTKGPHAGLCFRYIESLPQPEQL